jgi:sn-glycerol 3-phosphate transport system ATP-binding protein
MSHVIINSIEKVYSNGYHAIQPMNISIKEGEFVVLVGPSGCGKSTLLRMIAGLEDITEGEISIAGRVVNKLDPAERDIAMVFQNYALYPHMTVRKNIGYGLKNRGVHVAEINRKVEEACELLNLTEYLDRKPSQLSGGQRQRVAMGRAIVRNPSLFLFDEPLSNLDAKLRNQMRIEIKSIQRRLGVTAVYVTHDQVEAMTMADRIVVINQGHIEQIGSPSEIYHSPASTFVASFMGAPPMNLLKGFAREGEIFLEGSDQPLMHKAINDGPIIVGLRPEDCQLGKGDIEFHLDLIEELGANRLLHGKVADQSFTINCSSDCEVGAQHRIHFPESAICLFEQQTGTRL